MMTNDPRGSDLVKSIRTKCEDIKRDVDKLVRILSPMVDAAASTPTPTCPAYPAQMMQMMSAMWGAGMKAWADKQIPPPERTLETVPPPPEPEPEQAQEIPDASPQEFQEAE